MTKRKKGEFDSLFLKLYEAFFCIFFFTFCFHYSLYLLSFIILAQWQVHHCLENFLKVFWNFQWWKYIFQKVLKNDLVSEKITLYFSTSRGGEIPFYVVFGPIPKKILKYNWHCHYTLHQPSKSLISLNTGFYITVN